MNIEFRGKRIDNGEWIYGGYHRHLKRTPSPIGDTIKEKDWQSLIIQSGFSDWNMPKPINYFEVDSKTVVQFTGLKDKNNKKIYTNDIIEIKYANDESVHKFKVYYDYENAYYSLKEIGCDNLDVLCGWSQSQLEVIGNVFDNPELLDEEA